MKAFDCVVNSLAFPLSQERLRSEDAESFGQLPTQYKSMFSKFNLENMSFANLFRPLGSKIESDRVGFIPENEVFAGVRP